MAEQKLVKALPTPKHAGRLKALPRPRPGGVAATPPHHIRDAHGQPGAPRYPRSDTSASFGASNAHPARRGATCRSWLPSRFLGASWPGANEGYEDAHGAVFGAYTPLLGHEGLLGPLEAASAASCGERAPHMSDTCCVSKRLSQGRRTAPGRLEAHVAP